jgi:hypothetical protein
MRAGVYSLVGLLFAATAGFIMQPATDEAVDVVTVAGPAPLTGAGPAPAFNLGAEMVPELAPVPPLTLAPAPEPAAPRALKVALQAGHWKAQEAPDELEGLRNNGGTSGGGRA